jgi:monoamine oxidase
MSSSDTEVVIVGGGAAGIAAARRLHDASIPCLVVEARPPLGGRAWTATDASGFALDLGCGWLHSADRNQWRAIAEQQGRSIDTTPPPWTRRSLPIGFPLPEQSAFIDALNAFYRRLHAAAPAPDAPASTLLEPGGRWNGLINAVSTYVNGAELERVSARDFASYEDSGVNWRVVEGYGTVVAAHAADLPVVFDWKRLKIETANGAIVCDRAVVTVPSAVLAEEGLVFAPALPEKAAAAAGLPLGLADKLFLSLDGAEEFEKDSRLFGRTDRSATGAYHCGRRGCLLRLRRVATDRPLRQRLRASAATAAFASVG